MSRATYVLHVIVSEIVVLWYFGKIYIDNDKFQEDDKAKLVEETGLQLKQINNWFINQRKRNWHNNSQSSLKSKRKRYVRMHYLISMHILFFFPDIG